MTSSAADRKSEANKSDPQLDKIVHDFKILLNDFRKTKIIGFKNNAGQEFFKTRMITREGEFVSYVLMDIEQIYKKNNKCVSRHEMEAVIQKWFEHIKSVKEFDQLLIKWLEKPTAENLKMLGSKANAVKSWRGNFTDQVKHRILVENKSESEEFLATVDNEKDLDDFVLDAQKKEPIAIIGAWMNATDDPKEIKNMNQLANKSLLAKNLKHHQFDQTNDVMSLLRTGSEKIQSLIASATVNKAGSQPKRK